MSMSSLTAALPPDGRQSPTALAIARGTTRLLHSLGFSAVSELPLASGRRADLVALGAKGDVWIVEIKSSIADFRADQKWMDYRRHCDRLFFATTLEVPCDIFPLAGLIPFGEAGGAGLVGLGALGRLAGGRRAPSSALLARKAASPAFTARLRLLVAGAGTGTPARAAWTRSSPPTAPSPRRPAIAS